jgi:prepilin-type N-terminal cleavage/methylation domain-containing protein
MKKMINGGFTLIELVVVITIIVIFSGMSLAAYFNFSRNQSAINDARSLATTLRQVQAMAKNLVYPTGCTGLTGYRVFDSCDGDYNKDCQSLSASALCDGGDTLVFADKKIFSEAYFSDRVDIIFFVGPGSVANPKIFSIAEIGKMVVSVDENGNIVTK